MICTPTDDQSKPGVSAATQENAALTQTLDAQTCITVADSDFVPVNAMRDSAGLFLQDSSGAYLTSSA